MNKLVENISPGIEVKVYREAVSLANVEKSLKGMDIVVNAMDKVHPSVCLEREARRQKITIVDA